MQIRKLASAAVALMVLTGCGSASPEEEYLDEAQKHYDGTFTDKHEKDLVYFGEQICDLIDTANTVEEYEYFMTGIGKSVVVGGIDMYADDIGKLAGVAIMHLCPDLQEKAKRLAGSAF